MSGLRHLAVACVAAACATTAAAAAAADRPAFDVRPFAVVPDPPGLPEGIAVDTDGTTYVSTNPGGQAPGPENGNPSQLLAYGADGTVRRRYTLAGQDMTSVALPAYGNQAVALDAAGTVYIADKAPARIIRLDPRTGAQSDYTTFPDVPQCGSMGAVAGACSATAENLRPQPDYLAFAPDGSMYVTDFQQALIWRVPPGGGTARVAFTDFRLDSTMGPNGAQVLPDGKTLMFAQTVNAPGTGTVGAGRIYTLRINSDGDLSRLGVFYETEPMAMPDGFAVAASGRVFVNVLQQIEVLSPAGVLERRIPADAVANAAEEIPFDNPASSAFVGDRLLVTNQGLLTRDAAHFAVLDVAVGEPGAPLFRPNLASAGGAAAASTPATTAPAATPMAPKRVAARLIVHLSPRTDRTGVRRFTASGRVVPPVGVDRARGCRGRVAITTKAGANTVSTRLTTLRATCTFHTVLTLRDTGRFGTHRRLSVRTQFAGNEALLPRRARTVSVRVG